jgi:hypothetical protein
VLSGVVLPLQKKEIGADNRWSPAMMLVKALNLTLIENPMRAASNRFRDRIAEAWKCIPARAKRVLIHHFHTAPGVVHLCYSMESEGLVREPFGRCHWWYPGRTILTFLAPFVECATPASSVTGVIGHELVHCFRRGNATWTADEPTEEKETRRIAREWRLEEYGAGVEWEAGVREWRRENVGRYGHLTETRLLAPYVGEVQNVPTTETH